MSKICDYVYCKGDDVICGITGNVLGDIMGYDSKICSICKHITKEMLNSVYGLDAYNKKILIKYVRTGLDKIEYIQAGDWIDLRIAEDVTLKTGEFKLIPLGIAMMLPKGYEALVIPRSSTFKKYGIIQANSIGLIDESYCGNNDEWHFPAYATRDIEIPKNTRICQFRIIEHQPPVDIVEVTELSEINRGGFGSTGEK